MRPLVAAGEEPGGVTTDPGPEQLFICQPPHPTPQLGWPTVSLDTVRTWISQHLPSTSFSPPCLALDRVKDEPGPGLQSPTQGPGQATTLKFLCSSRALHSAFPCWPPCAGAASFHLWGPAGQACGQWGSPPSPFPSHPKVTTGSKEN